MLLPYRMRPGAGFVVLAGSLLLAIGFFAWALRTPPLDEVWRIQLELKVGDSPELSAGQIDLLQETLQRYPDLADHMLEGADSGLISLHQDHVVDRGYAYLVRKSSSSDSILVVRSPDARPLTIDLVTTQKRARHQIPTTEPLVIALPSTGPFPQLVGVHLRNTDTPPAPMQLQLAAAR